MNEADDRSLVLLSVSGTDRAWMRGHLILGTAIVFGIGYWVGKRRTLASSTSAHSHHRSKPRRFTALDGRKK